MPNPVCHGCGTTITLEAFTYWNYNGPVTCHSCKAAMEVVFNDGELLQSKPRIDPELIQDVHEDMPQQPFADYIEAVFDSTNGCYRSAAVMCRRSVQGALLIKSVKDDAPSKMIEEAMSKGILPGKMKQRADAVTFFGNKGAHPQDDELKQVDKLDVNLGLLVTQKILVHLFPKPKPVQEWVRAKK